ncbi:Scr1 family TA system antitoxin-like transcriptional regulator [Kribbella sp. NBC_00709]|uniref:Scr1 family TA system antitoxin-like transcriptional regulator n=1 Tax=Kribbella sp. NBC_00709 TaxID=2975972 RepID=UPI002E2B9AC8|nr:Scr1 family TA system antitoxin-like transcriptional regulator [Kribbella sp. NBC_00709]
MPAAAAPSPLGVELRWMRKVAGMSGKQAAEKTGVSQVAISRWETGARHPDLAAVDSLRSATIEKVGTLLADDTLTGAERRQLVEAFDRLTSEDYRLLLSRLVDEGATEVLSTFVITRTGLVERQQEIHRLEMQAYQIRHFQPLFAPGQLQTLEYARHLMLGYEKDPVKAEAAAEARVERVKVIMKGPRPKYHVVLTESALDVTFKDAPPDLRVGLLKQIAEGARRPHITVQIMPRGRPYGLVPIGSFVIYDIGKDDSVVLADTFAAQVTFRSSRDVRQYDMFWEELVELALDPHESLNWLADAIRESEGN